MEYGEGIMKSGDNRPNILFLMTDQQRSDALSDSGGWVKTPSIERIAANGVVFENCITNSPVCVSARAALATGLYPHNSGIWMNLAYRFNPELCIWTRAIKAVGYRT